MYIFIILWFWGIYIVLFLLKAGKTPGQLDTTVRKIIRYCQRRGIRRFKIRNLWSYQTPSPPELVQYWQTHPRVKDDNKDSEWRALFPETVTPGKCNKIIVAWGQLQDDGGAGTRVKARKRAAANYINKRRAILQGKGVTVGYFINPRNPNADYPPHPLRMAIGWRFNPGPIPIRAWVPTESTKTLTSNEQ